MIPPKEVKAFQAKILSWYEKNQRDLPWRKTRDPYNILVSEIMLQQTQVSRVIPKYEAWLKAFPDVQRLAKAKTSDVLRLWSGLGYNRRAIALHRLAQIIVSDFRGLFPQESKTLKTLPGIGDYTAAAVACFAFNQQVAVVDTNVRKVILTQFFNRHSGVASTTIESHTGDAIASLQHDTPKEIKTIADSLLPKGKAYEWNQALMDYASTMLKKEKIPVPKQSKFKGSNRYYRGQIIKVLLEEKKVSIKKFEELFQKDAAFIDMILAGLEKDGMVKKEGNSITFSSH